MAGANRRLTKEMNEISNDPVEGIDAAPLDGDLYHWQAMIDGPEGTPYDGGIFTIDIVFPPEYPFKAPKVGQRRSLLTADNQIRNVLGGFP